MAAGAVTGTAGPRSGDILAIDPIAGTKNLGALFMVDPVTGDRSVLSDFGNSAQGPLGTADETGVAIVHNRKIYVSALFSGSGGNGALFEVALRTGDRTITSDFGQDSLRGFLYYGLAEDGTGDLWANLAGTASTTPYSLIRVNPRNDRRFQVSAFSNSAQGRLVNSLRTSHSVTASERTFWSAQKSPSDCSHLWS